MGRNNSRLEQDRQCMCRVQSKCVGTRWRMGREVKGKLANGVSSQYSSHYLRTWGIHDNYRWCAHLGCQKSTRDDVPRRFKWTRPFHRKTKSGFCTCAITFQTQFDNEAQSHNHCCHGRALSIIYYECALVFLQLSWAILYSHLWSVRLYNICRIFSRTAWVLEYITEYTECAFDFPRQLLSGIFLILIIIQQDYHKSRQIFIFSQILIKPEYLEIF
jgi:hypothetical protein